MKREPQKTVRVVMPLELYERLKAQAEHRDRTLPGYIRHVLRRYLWHEENAPERLTGEWIIP